MVHPKMAPKGSPEIPAFGKPSMFRFDGQTLESIDGVLESMIFSIDFNWGDFFFASQKKNKKQTNKTQ